MEDLFSTVRDIAKHVTIADIDTRQIFFGEDYQHSTEDWAIKLQNDGSTFSWVAYAFGDIPMWELHVGVVLSDGAARVGLHCHKDSRPVCIEIVRELGPAFGEFYDSVSARELQYNKTFAPVGKRDYPEIGRLLGDAYAKVRTELRNRKVI